jgi:subtilase family serine protease
LAVDYPASSEYVTGLGGTEFTAQGAGTYFGSSNNRSGGSAASYIPEIAWNDSNQDATGGGFSTLVTKPSWQTGTGVPNDGHRDVPDIAFTASAKQDGLLICSAGSCTNGFGGATANVIGGTSAGPPAFSGVLALLVQKTGTPLGLLNSNLYSLAAISSNVFHDITQGNNQVVCQGGSPQCPATSSTGTGELGYTAGVGYDQTTGWGSLDSYNFVEQWSGDIQVTASPVNVSIQPGGSASTTVTIAPQNNFSGPVSLSCTPSSSLVDVTCSLSSTTLNTAGSAVLTISESSSAARFHSWPWLKKMPPVNPA